MSLLITKTRVPTLISTLVDRPRLLASLDTLLQPGCQVALVSAPAGFGKTTLLVQWLVKTRSCAFGHISPLHCKTPTPPSAKT